jgi:AMP-binding enzyme
MESSTYQSPYRLIPNILDQLAQDEPDKLYAELPVSPTDYTAGFQKITFGALANAVNGVAWWITETLGPGKDFPTLAYIGPNDLSHNILIIGAVKAGYKMLLTSPRYGVEAHTRLMKALDCKNIFTSSVITPMSQLVQKIADEHGNATVHQLPDLASLLGDKHQHFPYTKTFEEAHSEPLVVLHTSGTTGFPKPITWTHDWGAAFIHQRCLEPPEGFESLDRLIIGNRLLSLMPPFHSSHLFLGILFTFYCDSVCLVPPALALPTIEVAIAATQHTQVDVIALIPPHIEQLGRSPELLETLIKNGVKTLFWGGGPASKESTEKVASRINLFNAYGSTESGMWPVIRKSGPWDITASGDACFHPQANVEFRQQADGLFSAVVVKNTADAGVQPPFHIFKDATEFDSGDLFTRLSEPGKDHLWTYYGRADELQVFQNAMKWHPTEAERQIVSENSDLIQSALLDGTNRVHVVLLLEPLPAIATEIAAMSESQKTQKRAEILDRIWPTIIKINLVTPSWVQIDRKRTVFSEAEKPLARTAKGGVQRRQAIASYEPYIQKVLQDTDAGTTA